MLLLLLIVFALNLLGIQIYLRYAQQKALLGFEGNLEHDLSKPDGTPRKLMKELTQRHNNSVTRRSRLVATLRTVASLISPPEP